MRMSESNMGYLLRIDDSALGSLIVEMNIGQFIAVQQFQWCGAATLKTHSKSKN